MENVYIFKCFSYIHVRGFNMRKNKDIIEQIEEDLDNNLYSHKSRENLVEDDELTPEEAGFMEGYENAG